MQFLRSALVDLMPWISKVVQREAPRPEVIDRWRPSRHEGNSKALRGLIDFESTYGGKDIVTKSGGMLSLGTVWGGCVITEDGLMENGFGVFESVRIGLYSEDNSPAHCRLDTGVIFDPYVSLDNFFPIALDAHSWVLKTIASEEASSWERSRSKLTVWGTGRMFDELLRSLSLALLSPCSDEFSSYVLSDHVVGVKETNYAYWSFDNADEGRHILEELYGLEGEYRVELKNI